MSLSSDNMMKLMAYADGELEGAELVEAQKLLASDLDAMRFVEQIAGLGEIVELGHDDRSAKTIAKFDVADAVMALVEKEAKPARTSGIAKVVSIGARKTGAAKTAKSGNVYKIAGGFAAVLALAASVFVFTQHRTDEVPMASGPSAVAVVVTPADPAAGNPAPGTPVTSSSSSGTGVDVSTVNSPGNSVSVFYLPTANELSTSVVIWVDETGEK
jgi:hypothetical protein